MDVEVADDENEELDEEFELRVDIISDERSFCRRRLSLHVDNWTLRDGRKKEREKRKGHNEEVNCSNSWNRKLLIRLTQFR